MTMSAEEKEQIAQERYGKSFDELSTNEQKASTVQRVLVVFMAAMREAQLEAQ
ncbi:hypothetical protein HaLaN_15992, partial [Haematococcus lacustris]